MEATISVERVEHKANVFKVLSMLYKQPTDDLQYYLTHLKISVKKVYPHLIDIVEQLENYYLEKRANLTDLQVEHAKLFVGPFDVLAPPYSSVYLNEGRAVYGESTLDALNMYHKAGIDMATDFKDLPDHISVELEFIYFLYFQYREKEDYQYVKHIEGFIVDHLVKWVKPFTIKIEERASLPFYQLLSEILFQVVTRETVELTEKISD